MNAASLALLAAAVAYPVAGIALLRATAQPPGPLHEPGVAIAVPLLAAAAVLVAKRAGARVPWAGVAAFVAWVAAVGLLHLYVLWLAHASA